MSSNQSYSSSSTYASVSYSYTSSSSSSSSSSADPEGASVRYTESSTTDPTGTTIHRTQEERGKAPYSETTHIPAGGQIEDAGPGSGDSRRIEDVTDEEQARRDKEYEERMEDEYAKREGGA